MNSITLAHKPTPKQTWRLTALSAALGVFLSFTHVDAAALALGRVTALSALGEPFLASIEVPDINAEESASLKISLASPEAFRLSAIEYNPALASTQITLLRRSNGTSYLQLSSDKVVTDPFINLVINANWASGRIVRNYTLLLDPIGSKQTESVDISAPVAVLPAPVLPVQAAVISPAIQTPATIALETPKELPKATRAKPIAATQKSTASSYSDNRIKVESGATAGKIAAGNLPSQVSLEQMLIALLRGNPQAFVGGNINRLKAGAVLNMPTAEEAAAVSASEAKQSLVAQSKDFNSFRRKLAENAPALASKATSRVASGKIESKVEDQKAAAVTPDKLTLSKGGLAATDKSTTAAKENLEKIAKERQAKDDADRSAELAKNIKDLNKVASSAPVTPNASVTTVTKPAAVGAVTPPPPAIVKAPVVVATAAEPSVLDFLMDDPIVLPLAGGLLAALLAGGLYAHRKRKNRYAAEQAEDDALSDEHFEEQTFFNETVPSPGIDSPQRTTNAIEPVFEEFSPNAMRAGAKNVAPPVNAHTTVNPITEADVYLGYDRDAQAEEILIDGLKTQPENIAIYTKLLGIYAKRRDIKKFEQTASKAKQFLSDKDAQWLAISKQGLGLEPRNPLYQTALPNNENHFENISSSEFATHTIAQIDPSALKSPVSVDLDLDFNFASSFPANAVVKTTDTTKKPLVEFPDFSLEPTTRNTVASSATNSARTTEFVATATTGAAHAITSPVTKAMEFDLGHLSLDLNAAETKASPLVNHQMMAPLETKLALANEFYAIGDKTGAKMLAKEVFASSTGALKTRAETLLADIG